MVLTVTLDAGTPIRVAAHFYHEVLCREPRCTDPTCRFSHRTTVMVHLGECPKDRPEGVRCEGNEMPFGVGASVCTKLDQFEKAVGRKLAMSRALGRAFPGEPGYRMRAKIWAAYLQAVGINRVAA